MLATMPVTEKESLLDNGISPHVFAKERSAKSVKATASGKPNFMRLAGFLKTGIHLSDAELEDAISEARINAAMRGGR